MKFFKTIVVALLKWESRLILAKYKPFIVAVTGSVGKTSTKDAIYSVLKDQSHYVRKADKSMNSETGLPLTIIGVPNAWRSVSGWSQNLLEGLRLIFLKNEYPDCLVLELGADHPGDIEEATRWLRPDISVITQVSDLPVHVEFFSSPEQVFEEKACLAEAVKNNGTLILFADNEKVLSLAERVKDRGVKVISFGTAEVADVRGTEERVVYAIADSAEQPSKKPCGLTFQLTMDGVTQPVSVNGILGKSYMYPLLAAAAVGKARNVPMASIVKGLTSYGAPKGRMNIIAGMNGSTLIDDTYNSSPDAVLSALNTLKSIENTGAKIAVLGDMMELGQHSSEAHRTSGREVARLADELVTVGQRSRTTADEAIKAGMFAGKVHSFDTSVEAADYLKSIVKQGDIVLIKGSQSIRMERTVAALMEHPEQAGELLVRQEQEWLDKK